MENIKNTGCNIKELSLRLNEVHKNTINHIAERFNISSQISNLNTSIDHYNLALQDSKISTDNVISSLNSSSNLLTETITKNTDLTNHTLNSGLSNISDAISTLPNGAYALAFTSGALSALVAALAAFLLNYLYWKKINNHNRLSHFAAMSIEHLSEFENYAISYWISRKNNANSQKMVELEIRIRTQYSILKASLSELVKKIPQKYMADHDSINSFINGIYDDATGGAFESSSKSRDKKLALKISRKCLEIKTILIRYNQKIKD